MTEAHEFKQTSHLDPVLAEPATRELNAGKLLGRWLNTNRESRGVSEFAVGRDAEGFFVRAVGVGDAAPVEWPAARAEVWANLEEESGQRAIALSALFDFGFQRAETYVRLNKGVLVVVFYHTFLDRSGRSDYVTREFYYRPD